MKVAFYTLGCKVNQYETEAMREAFIKAGHTSVTEDAPFDAVVINSCTVTAEKPSAMASALLNLLTDTVLPSAGLRAPRTAPDTTAGMSAILFKPITASTTRPISAALSDSYRRISASAAAMSFSPECPTAERCATRWPRSTLRLSLQ